MKPRLFVAIVFLFLGLIAVPAWAATYYVDTSNASASDSNAGTDITRPWKTIGKANSTLEAGDTVLIKAGNYPTTSDNTNTVCPSRSGTATSPITYKNYGTDVVTITNDGTYAFAILLDAKSYVVVQGINATDLDYFVYIRNGSTYNTVSYGNFYKPRLYNGQPRTWVGSRIHASSKYNWVHHCRFSDYGAFTNVPLDSDFDIGGETSTSDMTSNNLFENNVLYHGGHHVMGVGGQYNVIRNNYIHNEAWSLGAANAHRGAVLYGDRCLSWMGHIENSGRNLFQGNRVGYAADPPDTAGTSGMSLNTSYNIIRNNYFYHNDSYGLSLSLGAAYYQNIFHNKIYNNTFFHNGVAPDTARENCGLFFAIYGGTQTINYNVVKNNLFYKHPKAINEYNQLAPSRKGIIALQTFVNNWDGDTQGDPQFVNASTVLGDPMDATTPDLSLQPTSPCKGQGTYLTTITSSRLREQRFKWWMRGISWTAGESPMFRETRSDSSALRSGHELPRSITRPIRSPWTGTSPGRRSRESVWTTWVRLPTLVPMSWRAYGNTVTGFRRTGA